MPIRHSAGSSRVYTLGDMGSLAMFLVGVLGTVGVGIGSALFGAVVGAWAQYKLGLYHGDRRTHHTALREKILEPMRLALKSCYGNALVEKAPICNVYLKIVRENPTVVQEPAVSFSDPAHVVEADLDTVLLRDARQNHYGDLCVEWDRLRTAYTSLLAGCEELVQGIANDARKVSSLPSGPPVSAGAPYIQDLALAADVYMRLFGFNVGPILVDHYPGGALLIARGTHKAEGSVQQIDKLKALLDGCSKSRAREVAEIRAQREKVWSAYSALLNSVATAIHDQNLPGKCKLAHYYWW